jgi:hypothetical protein
VHVSQKPRWDISNIMGDHGHFKIMGYQWIERCKKYHGNIMEIYRNGSWINGYHRFFFEF